MIMIVKTPGSQMGSPAPAEEGGEESGMPVNSGIRANIGFSFTPSKPEEGLRAEGLEEVL